MKNKTTFLNISVFAIAFSTDEGRSHLKKNLKFPKTAEGSDRPGSLPSLLQVFSEASTGLD